MALFSLSLFVRIAQLHFVREKAPLYLWGEGVPVLSTLDGYYYLRLGEMVREGVYRAGEPDPFRNAPDNQLSDDAKKASLPSPVPLLSVLLAGASWISGEPPDRAFLSLPLIPLLASLLVAPLFLLGRRLGGAFVGMGMALGGVFCVEYMIRTDPLRLDTDALNPFFLFLIVYLLLRSAEQRDKGSYLWLLATGLSAHLFYWWYSRPGLVVPLIGAYGLVLLLYRRPLKEVFIKTALLILVCNPLWVYRGVFNFLGMLRYVPGLVPEETGFIPRSVFVRSVSELKHLPTWEVFRLTATHPLLGYVGIAGWLVLFWRRRWLALMVLPALLLGAMTFTGARRFMIYLGPFVGMGLGVLVQVVADIFSRKAPGGLKPALYIGLGGLLFISVVPPQRFDLKPGRIIAPAMALGFHRLQELSPEEAFVWAWWDYGYPIAQIARRAVYHDGGGWGNVKNLLVARSFVAPDDETLYNLVNGTTALGEEGIRDLLKEGLAPAEILRRIERGYYNRDLPRPVYIVLTGLDAPKFYWISFFGTWYPEAQKGKHLSFAPLGPCRLKPEQKQILCSRGLLDLKARTFCFSPRRCLKVRELHLVGLGPGDRMVDRQVLLSPGEERGLIGLLLRKGKAVFGYLTTPESLKTAFHRLFFLGSYDPRYLELVYSDFPAVRIYRVRRAALNR